MNATINGSPVRVTTEIHQRIVAVGYKCVAGYEPLTHVS